MLELVLLLMEKALEAEDVLLRSLCCREERKSTIHRFSDKGSRCLMMDPVKRMNGEGAGRNGVILGHVVVEVC